MVNNVHLCYARCKRGHLLVAVVALALVERHELAVEPLHHGALQRRAVVPNELIHNPREKRRQPRNGISCNA